MAKLCPRGKAAAKRKFKVYPSAYANMYASKVCKGKVRASAASGGSIDDKLRKLGKEIKANPLPRKTKDLLKQLKKSYSTSYRKKYESGGFVARGCGKIMSGRSKKTKVY